MSVGFLFDCYLRGRAEPTGTGTAGTRALVRLPSSAWLPPAGECARRPACPTVRGCGWGEGGAGSSEAKATAVRGEGERRERGEGEGRDGLGVCCSAPLLPAPRPHPWQPLLQLRVTAAPPLLFLARLCGQGSAVGDSPARRRVGLSGFGSGSSWGPQGRGGRDSVSPLCSRLNCAAQAPPLTSSLGSLESRAQACSLCVVWQSPSHP